jgi:hypothetical protein
LINFKDDENPHHSIVLHNLNNTKNIGMKRWFNDQKKNGVFRNVEKNIPGMMTSVQIVIDMLEVVSMRKKK